MTTSHVSTFDTTLHTTHEWLRELELSAGLRTQAQAYTVLRAVLHVLRDRLTPDEAVDLGAQLPMLIRGFYYEGWKPSATPTRQRSLSEFLASVPKMLNPDDAIGPETAVRAVFQLLSNRISAGEIADVRHMLPADVANLWPAT